MLSVAVLAWSGVFHGGVTRKPVSFLTTNDAVIALRLGGGWTTVAEDEPYYDGWIVLFDAQGRGQVASVDEVVDGDVLWSDRGVFFGSSSRDYVTTDGGTQQVARRYVRDEDVQRYELSGGTLAVVKRRARGIGLTPCTPMEPRRVSTMQACAGTSASVGRGSWRLRTPCVPRVLGRRLSRLTLPSRVAVFRRL